MNTVPSRSRHCWNEVPPRTPTGDSKLDSVTGKDDFSLTASSLCRRPDGGAGPAVSDHPRTRPHLYSAAAAPRVGHHAILHHHGNHLPDGHLWTPGGVALAQGGHQVRPLDRLHRQ